MGDVLALLLFILLFFSVIGLHAFKGDYYDRCRTTPEPVGDVWPLEPTLTRFCSIHGNGDYDCPNGYYCGSPDFYDLPLSHENQTELPEAYYGTLSFNDAWVAFLLNFNVITFDSWADVMYKAQDSNNTYVARFFFPLLIFLGAFFCLNLIVAVVFSTFQKFRQLLNRTSQAEELVRVLAPPSENGKAAEEGALRQHSQIKSTSSPMPSDEETQKKRMGDDTASSEREDMSWLTKICLTVTGHCLYKPAVVVLILSNLLVISLDRHEISERETDIIDALNTVFFVLFFMEMVVNIGASGFITYIGSPFNVADAVINVFGLVEVVLTYSSYSNGTLFLYLNLDYTARGIIVIFRACRAFKLTGKWPALGDMLKFFWNSRGDILNFVVLVCLFDFMFGIIGMELFAHEVKFSSDNKKNLETGESSRVNFDDIGHAILSSFTVQISDNWSTYYVLYMRYSHIKGTLYFILAIIVLNILLVNLFVGILLENFFSNDQKDAMAEEERRNEEFNEMQRKLGKPKTHYKHRERTLLTILNTFRAILSHAFWAKAKGAPEKKTTELFGVSLGIFQEENKFRLFVAHIVKHYGFQIVYYGMIFVNSVVLTFYTPLLDPDSGSFKAAFAVDVITTTFFTVEILMKSVAFGFVRNGPESYLRSIFNCVDLLSTIIALLTFMFAFSATAFQKLFLLFRILRAFRLLEAYDGFRIRIHSLMNGLGKILQVLLITMLFILFFGIIGTHFFKGTFYYCDQANGSIVVQTAFDCMNLGGEWRKRDIGYDNILVASMTLFELFSGKSWCNSITFLPDIVGIDFEPVRDVSTKNLWFCVVYMIILFMFIRAVLSGVISNTFFVHNEKLQGLHELTNAQRRWVSLSKIIFKASPKKAV